VHGFETLPLKVQSSAIFRSEVRHRGQASVDGAALALVLVRTGGAAASRESSSGSEASGSLVVRISGRGREGGRALGRASSAAQPQTRQQLSVAKRTIVEVVIGVCLP